MGHFTLPLISVETFSNLLESPLLMQESMNFGAEQAKDTEVLDTMQFITMGALPVDDKRARRIALQESQFTLDDGILCYLDPKQEHQKRAGVPHHLRAHHASSETIGWSHQTTMLSAFQRVG